MSSLARKCVFIDQNIMQKGNPMELFLKFKVPEIQKGNMPADSALRVNERNGVICLVITFGPRALVIKMSKMADFLYILLMKAKKTVTV